MARGYDGKFQEPKDKGNGSGGALTWGIIMAILLVITRVWFVFLPLSLLSFFKALQNKRKRDTLLHCCEYGNLMGMREYVTVTELAETFGRSRETVRRELKSGIARNYFGKEAYLDVARDCWYCPLPEQARNRNGETRWADVAMEVLRTLRGDASTNPQTAQTKQTNAENARNRDFRPHTASAYRPEAKAYEPRKDARQPGSTPNETASAKPTEPKKPDYSEELERILNELYELNEQIQDEGVSRRIDRIGMLTGSIFRVVIEKPERENDVRKFMNYYLPTTLKLLKSYSLMEAQSYQGENIRESRKKIEETLDMLIEAFERLLDKLFRDDALDIATDIDVLKTMVAGDGLSGKGQLHL